MAPYQALTTLRAESEQAKRFRRLLLLRSSTKRQALHTRTHEDYRHVVIKLFAQPNAESAVSDLAPSRPAGTLSQVRYRALGA
jgi:hypothetical protein